jgi:anaerobic selenocysteine-containing dehydrogenase
MGGIESHRSVTISSRRISIRATAVITPIVQPGGVFMTVHHAGTNLLTLGKGNS